MGLDKTQTYFYDIVGVLGGALVTWYSFQMKNSELIILSIVWTGTASFKLFKRIFRKKK